MKRFKVIIKFANSTEKRLTQINLIFIFVFLVIWDYANNGQFLNAMSIGVVMFGPMTVLWFLGSLRAIALLVLVSIFQFVVMLVFIAEGFELAGLDSTIKSIFWIPYLVMAGVNGFWGLKIYSGIREKKITKNDS